MMQKLTLSMTTLLIATALALPASGALTAYDPFDAVNGDTVNGLDGTGTGFGWSGNWNDSDTDTVDRNLSGTLGSVTDLAPAATGGRTFTRQNTGTGVFRNLAQAYGTDNSEVWVSYRWRSTDTATVENLRVVDFNDTSGSFGFVVGQLRGLGGDNSSDGQYDMGTTAAGNHVNIAPRDAAANNFVVLRFNFGAADVDSVDVWWNATLASFDINTPTASLAGTDYSFNRVTIRSGGASSLQGDTMDEIRIGMTVADVTNIPTPAALPMGLAMIGLVAARRRR